MGVTRAADAYAKIYGHLDKRVHLNENLPKDLPPNNPDYCNVYLLDLPTYHVPSIYALSARAGEAIVRTDSNMGQMIVFESNGVIYDILYDKTSCIDPSDIKNNVLTSESEINTFQNFKSMSSLYDSHTIRSFCVKFKKHVIDNKREVSIVPVNTGASCCTLEKLREHAAVNSRNHFSRLQPEDVITSLSSHHQYQQKPSYLAFRNWLTSNGLDEPKYINFEHIFNAVYKNNQYGNNSASDNYMYNSAKTAKDMEGLLLLYGHYLIGKLKNVINDKRANKKIVMFTDGKSPVIKNITKVKREEARKKKLKEQHETTEVEGGMEMMIKEACAIFDRVIMSIPSTLLIQCVVLDVLRVVLFDQLNINGDHFFFSSTNGSEAEDDIVRLVAMAANIDLAVKGDVKTLTKISSPSLSNPEKIRKIEIQTDNYLKRTITWEKACRDSLFNAKHNRVIALSYDSDVLPKWNMLISHSQINNKKTSSKRLDMSTVANNIDSIYFYRSLMERWNTNNVNRTIPLGDEDYIDYDDENPSNPLKRKTFDYYHSNSSSVNKSKVCVYDMLQSPLCLSGEDTLLLLLTNGCDYNDALVSSDKTVGQHVSKIREEVAMFKKYACLCPLVDDVAASRRCDRCSKIIEEGFVTIKKFLIENAVDVTLKEEFPEACNVASNLFAMIAMSSFNTKMFGSGLATPKATNENNSKEVSRIVNYAKIDFFNKHTQGGIPLSSCDLERERCDAFGDIGSIKREAEEKKNILEMYEDCADAIFLPFDSDMSSSPSSVAPLVDETVLMDLFNTTPSKSNNVVNTTEYDDDVIKSILFDGDEVEDIHTPKKMKKNKENAFSCLPLDLFKVSDDTHNKHQPPKEKEKEGGGGEEDDDNVDPALPPVNIDESIKKLDEAMTIGTCSLGLDDFFLSVLSNMIGCKEIVGFDDKRENNETYCSKVMNLLIILYANMAGQQDPTVSRNQYIPTIHIESTKNRAKTTTDSKRNSVVATTRSYFVAALNELNFYMYRAELNAFSTFKQSKRQKWDKLAEKLTSYDKEMEACGMAKSTAIKPVYGLSRAKPWSTLALIGAKLHLEFVNNGNNT